MASKKPPLDAAQIDALYGLEPVLEPGSGDSAGVAAADWLELQCPFCGETIGTSIDLSAGSHSYVEDCQVCCQPMLIHLECNDAGELQRGWAQKEN